MIARGVLFLLALQIVPIALSAEISKDKELPSKVQESRQTTPVAPPDPYADLFIGTDTSAQPTTQPTTQPARRAAQPTFESWDVLRQYPRYDALPPPSVPEPKEQDHPKETKEKPDV
jgi:hypothetical protein